MHINQKQIILGKGWVLYLPASVLLQASNAFTLLVCGLMFTGLMNDISGGKGGGTYSQ